MVIWVLGKSFCIVMVMMWEVVWWIFFSCFDLLVWGRVMVLGEIMVLVMDCVYKKFLDEGI